MSENNNTLDNDFFEINSTEFWQEYSDSNHQNFVSVINPDGDGVIILPSKWLESQSEEQVIKKADEFYYQYNYFKEGFESKTVEFIAQWVNKESEFLDLVAKQLAFHLFKYYEHLLKIRLETVKSFSNSELPPLTIILDHENTLVGVKLELNAPQVKKVITHLKTNLTKIFDSANTWGQVALELLTYQSISAYKKMEDGGEIKTVDELDDESKNEIFNRYFNQYLRSKSPELKFEIDFVLRNNSQQIAFGILEDLDLPNLTLADLDKFLGFKSPQAPKPIPVTETKLTEAIVPVPSFAAIGSAIAAQIRKDLWGKDSNGLAYLKHQAKNNSNNYIEHYISNPGDIEILPWEQAEQIIDKFGFNTVKLHLIFAAHTMNQSTPWSGKFHLKGSDIIKYLGWDRRTDLPTHQKLNEIAKAAFVLDCLLVKSVWVEGRNKKGGINASTPTGRMWNVVVDPRGELNLDGKVDSPEEVYITVQPGLIFESFLNKAGSRLKDALYQFGYLAQDILRIDPYHDELALRLAIHLTMDSRVHLLGKYRVETLLKALLPHTVIDIARSDKRKGYDLKQRWDNALKLLLKLNWQIQFDEESYPVWLRPGVKQKKPPEARKMKIIDWLLSAKLTINPPKPIPELLAAAKTKPKIKIQRQIKPKVLGLTSDQIRKARNAKGWSQRQLAGCLGVSNALVGYWEKGKRSPSPEMEIKLRQILPIED